MVDHRHIEANTGAQISLKFGVQTNNPSSCSELLDLALRHMVGGIIVISESEAVEAINDHAFALFGVDPRSVSGEFTLSRYLELIGDAVGWEPARTARVIDNHRLWKREGIDRDLDHDFGDGRVVRVGYKPISDRGAVLTYYDVTSARKLERFVHEQAEHARRFKTEIADTVTQIAKVAETVVSTSKAAETASKAAAIGTRELAASAHKSADTMVAASLTPASLNSIISGLADEAQESAVRARSAADHAHKTSELSAGLAAHTSSPPTGSPRMMI